MTIPFPAGQFICGQAALGSISRLLIQPTPWPINWAALIGQGPGAIVTGRYRDGALSSLMSASSEAEMSDWRQDTREDYERKGLGVRAGYGTKPVLLLVDFINGFTDPSTPLGGDLTGQIAATEGLLAECRAQAKPSSTRPSRTRRICATPECGSRRSLLWRF